MVLGVAEGDSDAGLQSQLLGRCHSSSKYKIRTVVLVLNICGILPNHYKQAKVNSEKGHISGRIYFLFSFHKVMCRLVFCDSVLKGKTLLRLRTSFFVSYSQTSQSALFESFSGGRGVISFLTLMFSHSFPGVFAFSKFKAKTNKQNWLS